MYWFKVACMAEAFAVWAIFRCIVLVLYIYIYIYVYNIYIYVEENIYMYVCVEEQLHTLLHYMGLL